MLELASFLYGIILKIRYKLYNMNILKKRKVDGVYVVCIGNITAGGTGKTPAVQYFANKFIAEGKKTAVVSRGYMGKRKFEPFLVSDGEKIQCTPKESGDEPYLHAISLKCPIVVAKDRYKAVEYCKEKFNSEIVIMDDGFQHMQLERDWNIVLIDATNPFGGKKLLPAGRLREPLLGLERANEFIITKSDMVTQEKLENIVKELKSEKKKISKAVHFPEKFLQYGKIIEKEKLLNKKALLFSGIANPKNFRKSLDTLGIETAGEISYRDHYNFSVKDVKEIEKKFEESNAEIILTTEKDFVKIEKICSKEFSDKLYVLKIEFKILEENI